ncbi:MAG: transglutaminase TgpA family protein [Elainellaceae cyanobacterium]
MSISSPQRSPQIPLLKQLWQRIESAPRPEPEDSITLRILVQLLVTVGIIATDVASADVAVPLWISLWAVPMSAGGAIWSWYRRRSRNIPVKFCIAIAMLIALGLFFVNLLAEQSDTRLALAELLIQLQVFHSFDLPRRKDLGYSMMIGLILIGVAATLSQTLVFAPLLLLFLAIALPVLMLDYRSRLGLLPKGFKRLDSQISFKKLAIILAITIGLGLVIFACLPRLPGYQLRTFPVSAPIDFDGDFDSGTITNPGYVREGQRSQSGGSSSGEGGFEDGPGQLNSDSYYGFNSRINQNLRGTLTPKVVMRVRSQAEGFWRVLAFDHYTGQGWEISRNDDTHLTLLSRPEWSFRFLLPSSVPVGRTREVVQSYTIVSELPNLIPAMYEAWQLFFPTREIVVDAEGGVRSPVLLTEGLTYTAISLVPYRDRTQLRQANTTYSDEIRSTYLQIPEAIAERVRLRTEEILAESPNPLSDPYEIALYLAQFLKQNYTIQPDLPFLSDDEDLVDAFLFRYDGGYPDHFSTTLTLMLRSIGIPARLVAGFGSGEFNPFTGFYVVRNTDAYALTEVYFGKQGWFMFDPIPGHDVIPPSITDYETFSLLRRFWNWIAGWLPSPVSGFLSGVFIWIVTRLGQAIGWVSALFTEGWSGFLLGVGIVSGLAFAGWLIGNGARTLRDRLWLSRLPPVESIYQQMLRGLAVQGFRKSSAQTPLEYARQLDDYSTPAQADIIHAISHAYVGWRYGGQIPNLEQLRNQLKALKRGNNSDRRQ